MYISGWADRKKTGVPPKKTGTDPYVKVISSEQNIKEKVVDIVSVI